MNPTKTEYPTSALDKGKIGDKQTRLDERNKLGRKGKKGGEVNYVYNTKFSIPPPSQSTSEFSKVLAPQMPHHGSHSNDNGVFCNDHYRQRTK